MGMKGRLRLGVLISIVGLVAAACATAVDVDTMTTSGGDTSSSIPATTSSSTVPDRGLDLSGLAFVVHGPDGIRLDDGTVVWQTEPFPAGILRDRGGRTGVHRFQRAVVVSGWV